MSVILGLESSCDDSAVALVTSDRRIMAQAVVGQNAVHQPYGGVVPEIATRAHVEILPNLIRRVLDEAKLAIRDVDAIAATAGPGRIGGELGALGGGRDRDNGRTVPERRSEGRHACRQGTGTRRWQAADRRQPPRRACA